MNVSIHQETRPAPRFHVSVNLCKISGLQRQIKEEKYTEKTFSTDFQHAFKSTAEFCKRSKLVAALIVAGNII